MSSRIKTEVKKTFEFWCEVNCNKVIVDRFPEHFRDERIFDIPDFAFPCELGTDSVQSYSFVLTTDDSKWRFGFCRHDPGTRSAFVLVSYLPWHDTFLRLLSVLAELRRTNSSDFRVLLSETYNKGVPDPGSTLKIFYNGGQSYFVFEQPLGFQLPSIPQNHNLNLYYNFVDPKDMISIFAAMLAERRIIFTSRRLDKLSSCIQAANAFLYPMVWQHIYIPVLPMKLKDYLSAPMPYLIGVPEPVLETMTSDELGEVVIFNCDTKTFDSPFDDVNEMPVELISQMKKQLSQTNEHIGDRVSKIFLAALVQLIGGYRDAVEFRDSGKTFNRERFIESRPSHLRYFLTKMMDLQIFQQFIDERLEMLNTGLGFSDEFELENVRYAEKMKKRGRNYAFLKNVKDKTNPAVKSAVKSVKESSRGVKTVYKDLKSKFSDVTPPKTEHFRSHLASNYLYDRPDSCIIHKAGGTHHSAPSTPMCNKRAADESISNYDQYSNSKAINNTKQKTNRVLPSAMSSSNTHILLNGCARSSSGNSCNNKIFDTSPNNSPAQSLCSSEMNLSQELQNHPLFKTPAVDRSLKPNRILEVRVYPRNLPKRSSHLKSDQKFTMSKIAHINAYARTTTNSVFDNPPETKSPPVPNRRQDNLEYGVKSHNQCPNLRNFHENRVRNVDSSHALMLKLTTTLPSSSGACTYNDIPISSLRYTNDKESLLSSKLHHLQVAQHSGDTSSLQETLVKDLILLDDNCDSNFGVEDFDPLNQNARPLPKVAKNCTTLPSTSNVLLSTSVSNKLNPFITAHLTVPLQPPALPTSAPPPLPHSNDDFELLRKYGLDQFTIEAIEVSSGNSSKNTQPLKTNMSGWTKFD